MIDIIMITEDEEEDRRTETEFLGGIRVACALLFEDHVDDCGDFRIPEYISDEISI